MGYEVFGFIIFVLEIGGDFIDEGKDLFFSFLALRLNGHLI